MIIINMILFLKKKKKKKKGAYGYFYHSFADLINYPDLRDGVYQSFREFGNVFIFVFQLDKAMVIN